MDSKNLNYLIDKFKDLKILLIGDAMLDCYLSGDSDRICREAPVPIVDIEKVSVFAGGAANTAVNAARLGAKVFFISVVGEDTEGQNLFTVLQSAGVDTGYLVSDSKRRTLTKKRVIASSHLLLRYDYGSREEVTFSSRRKIIDSLTALYPDVDLVLISDYGYGMLGEEVRTHIASLQKKNPKVVVIDAKDLTLYKSINATAVKPNYKEALSLLGSINTESPGQRAGQLLNKRETLFARVNSEIVALTLDKEGALVLDKKGLSYRTYSQPVDNSKAAGAGDTYVSVFSMALSAGASTPEAAELASSATDIVLRKDGTAYCSAEELKEYWLIHPKYLNSFSRLAEVITNYRIQGKRIVFTNGYFDILTSSHIRFLNRSKALGDILIVGINSDEKADGAWSYQPIKSAEERMRVLAGVESVDHVITFSDITPIHLISLIQPDIFTKGATYQREELPEASLVEELGGSVQIIPLFEPFSPIYEFKKKEHFSKKEYSYSAYHQISRKGRKS